MLKIGVDRRRDEAARAAERISIVDSVKVNSHNSMLSVTLKSTDRRLQRAADAVDRRPATS